MIWQTRGGSTCDPQAYSFTYDAMDRLKSAQYAERDANQQWSLNVDRYSLENIAYDHNGNITSLQRKGVNSYNTVNGTFGYGMMDNLSYTYRGNRLIRVEDQVVDNLPVEVEQFRDRTKTFKVYNFASHEYQYDANGNVKTDYNKGISVVYNSFNKPAQVNFTDPNDNRFGKKITYVYMGDGTKIRQEVRKANGQVEKRTDYVGGFQYETQANANGNLGSRQLLFFAHDEGRIRLSGNNLQFEYYLKDHLGNTRVTFGDPDGNGIADPLQEDHYYPFGMKQSAAGSLQASPANQYRYNGKEYQDELSLGWYDYGFRWFSADIARFVSVDPLAEDFYSLTTFQYASNSPIYMIDLDGLEGIPANEVNSEDITSVAETTTESMKEKYGNTQAVCNFGVRTAVEEITGSKSLFPESSGGQVKGNGQANTIGTSLANGEIDDFEEIEDVDYETMQNQVNDGSVIVGVFNSAEEGGGGHIVM
ncbi:MAG: RHS repeat-associated core domain-containing protein, partial [Bacteroidota bacterium]